MTESQEFNAPTVEEALEKASQRLDESKEHLSYEVLDPGSAGFLGMGSRDARVLVTSDSFPAETGDETHHEEPPPEDPPEEMDFAEADEDIASPTSSVNDNSTDQAPPSEKPAETPEVPDELLNDIEQFVNHSVDKMGLDARVDVYDAEDFIAVDVASEETGLFIGQKGETIDALQYLLNVAIYKERPYVKRIVIDSEGYRQRRVEAVQGIAHRMARKAVRERRPVELPPMNTSERRIVHMFLKENDKVATTSQGAGEDRRVTVSPS